MMMAPSPELLTSVRLLLLHLRHHQRQKRSIVQRRMSCWVDAAPRKRKLELRDDDCGGAFPLDDLDQDILEKVLSRLPASSFFRLGSVCKRWKAVGESASFRMACAEVQSRDPWYYMARSGVGGGHDGAVMFDSSEMNWKSLNVAEILRDRPGSVPVASSGGLVCFRTGSGDFVVLNPITGSFRDVQNPIPGDCCEPIQAIAMQSIRRKSNLFRLILVFGEIPRLYFRVLDSKTNRWGTEIALCRNPNNSPRNDADVSDEEDDSEDPIYFLSKSGNEVVTNTLLRSPLKQFSSVLTSKNSHDTIHFLSPSGKIVACNLMTRTFDEYPPLLPLCSEYSIDIVDCGGEPMVVLLSEFFESANLRMWKFNNTDRSWQHVTAMPPSMSHGLYGKRADVNCSGSSNGTVLMCISSSEGSRYVAYHHSRDEWTELLQCHVDGEVREFETAFCFEPRIEIEASLVRS
ncbi:hypothetical protein MLD38_006510 [Melastoma candidum]|uniref:Uncharacterized protein n=1 Tax=Melastoma candidum TaxID=119954 RepID=A0ACB9RN40_9MYRT|nr:hypothetical protein MLD38_006510 [Melastoma candidum]